MSKLIEYLQNKKVLILGFGREGQASYRYIRKYLPDFFLTVADRNKLTLDDPNVALIFGEDYLSHLGEFDLVLKSPGIAFLSDVTYPETTEITCETDLFLRFCKPTVVGVTGTKGKTTTSTLIYEMLKAGGLRTCLVGNIGVPVFEKADEEKDLVAVIEMSSHQLEFTKASPHVAVLVNLYEEHLDHYKDGFRGYVAAKLHIADYQQKDDYFIYDPAQKLVGIVDWQRVIKGRALLVPHTETPTDPFLKKLQSLTPHLPGDHNLQDLGYAVAAARCFGVSDEAIEKAVASFGGIEHRMELVGTFGGVTYYNDSIATVPMAVESAIRALPLTDTLIFGGLDRGIDYDEFVHFLAESGVQNLIGLPETGHDLLENPAFAGKAKRLFKAKNMEEAVKKAAEWTGKGKICLFSPAAASYNVYKNFEEKGDHYKSLVRAL